MAKLYELIKEIEDFELDVDEDTGEILNIEALDALEVEKQAKIENICLWIKNLLSDAEAYKREKTVFMEKERLAKNKAERLKGYIQGVLAGEKFKTNRVTVSYRKSESVEVMDVWELPEKYLKYSTPAPDKMEIKKAIKAGNSVVGCRLVEKQNMQIK